MENSKKPIFFREDELPLKAPAAADAWLKMRGKLDSELPVKEKRRRKLLLFLLTLLLFTVIFNLLLKTKTSSVATQENTATSTEIKTIENNNLSNDQLNKPANNVMAQSSLINQHLVNSKETETSYINQINKKKQPGQTKWLQKTRTKKVFSITAEPIDNTSGNENDQTTNNENNITESHVTDDSINKTTSQQANDIKAKESNDKDEEDEEADEKEKEENDKIKLNAGLQWNLQAPLQGTGYYFTAANNSTAPWQQFIPGLWVTVIKDRLQLGAELNPYFSYTLPSKTVNEKLTTSGTTDTIINTTTLTQINKLIGTAVNFSYGYRIKSAWWIQAGIQTQWWRKGITTNDITQEKLAITNPSQPIIIRYKESHSTVNYEWDYINKFQLNINAGLHYQKEKWQAAIRIGLPIAPISQTGNGPARNLRTELIFRWTLINKMINSSK